MASTSKDPKNGAAVAEKKEDTNVLGPLEEDDEFEEFDVEDWEDKESDLTNIARGKASSAPVQAGKAGTDGKGNTLDALWEDNWDDDDVDDDFSKKLRAIIEKTSGGDVKMKDK
ncbi:hypothetical protein BT69DRAFT_1280459 [Atractiella rhizophila]|nr:hypothetical protein BT69DRAFT_1280459 [Atractiella rhizophila]